MAAQGERIAGGFILITGLDGIRYAVRPQSMGIIHDADECRDETLVQLHGGHVVRVPCSLDEVLGWFSVHVDHALGYATRAGELTR